MESSILRRLASVCSLEISLIERFLCILCSGSLCGEFSAGRSSVAEGGQRGSREGTQTTDQAFMRWAWEVDSDDFQDAESYLGSEAHSPHRLWASVRPQDQSKRSYVCLQTRRPKGQVHVVTIHRAKATSVCVRSRSCAPLMWRVRTVATFPRERSSNARWPRARSIAS